MPGERKENNMCYTVKDVVTAAKTTSTYFYFLFQFYKEEVFEKLFFEIIFASRTCGKLCLCTTSWTRVPKTNVYKIVCTKNMCDLQKKMKI